MDKQITNATLLAALRTFYDEGHDVIHAISSAVLVTMNEQGDSLSNIQNAFKEKYKMNITESPLKTAIKRLGKEKLVSYKTFNAITVTDEGQKEIVKLNAAMGSIEREFRQLVNDLAAFCNDHKIKIAPDSSLDKELLQFIDENIGLTSVLVSDSTGKKTMSNSMIAEYIVHVESENATLFAMIQNLFFGRLYLSMLQTRSDYVKTTKFEPLSVYIDTNLLLSALGLTSEQESKQAQELLDVIKNSKNITIGVFDFTVDEARRVLNAYSTNKGSYVENIKVSSTYHRLNTIKIDKYALRLILENIETKIAELGINIKRLGKTESYEDKFYRDLYSEISTWSGMLDRPKNENALQHDALALRLIEAERNGIRTQLLEKAQAIFITPDLSIKEVVLEKAKVSHNVPLAYTPVELVSYLWFRDVGDKEVATSAVRQSVMAYARERLISHNLWDRFLEELKEAEKQNKLTSEDIGFILASDDTEQRLAQDQARAIKQLINPTHVKHLRYQHEQLTRSNEDKGNKLEKVASRISTFAHISSHVIVTLLAIFFIVALAFPLYILLKKFGVDTVASVISVGSLLVILFAALLFGKKFELSKSVISTRANVVAYIRHKIVTVCERIIYGVATQEKPNR